MHRVPPGILMLGAALLPLGPGGGGSTLVAAEAPDTIELRRQELRFAPTRSDLTVGIAVFTVFARDEDWTVTLPKSSRDDLHDRGSWKVLELKEVETNRFELPSMKIKAAKEASGPLCVSLKVWFNEITNQYDSPFYVHVPDRYALVSLCTKDTPEARARFSQNRVATLEQFRERLKEPFVLKLKDDRVPWRPGIMVDSAGSVYFHSLIVARPGGQSYSTHITGIWKLEANEKLERLPVPDLRMRPSWPERVGKLAKDRFGALATISFSERVAVDSEGNLYATSHEARGGDVPALYQIVRIDQDGSAHPVAGSVIGHRDGAAPDARFSNITALTVGPKGNIYLADGDIQHGSWIRRVSPDGRVATIAGGSEVGFADGEGTDARFFTPSALALDPAGRLFVADPVNSRIRSISPEGVVTTVEEDSDAPFLTPTGVAIGPDGALYVLDGGPKMARVRRRSAGGSFQTLVVVDEE